MSRLLQLILILMVFISCDSSKTKPQQETENILALHKVHVKEVIQTTKYTYLFVKEDQKEYWTAVSKQEINPGDEFIYMDDVVTHMTNFHSQELDRDFREIEFISQITPVQGSVSTPHGSLVDKQEMMAQPTMKVEGHTGRKAVPEKGNISIEPVKGGVSIEELYSNKAKYSGRKIKVRGSVVKVNNQIMNRNWVHLQDGTKHGAEYDLTCTTQEFVQVGDIVTLEGIIALDKDFTSGYFYPLIMEEAQVLK